MSDKNVRIFPLGDSAVTVEFGDSISIKDNKRAIALADHFAALSFPGFVESVPAYASTTIFYDVIKVKKNFDASPTAFDAVKDLAKAALVDISGEEKGATRHIEIPVQFDKGYALDLADISRMHALSAKAVIEIFLSGSYRVFMIGFLPGFSYMGEVDERIATPRKETPRTLVPKGSVGIAGKQTGIYSLESPGGWQIIGRTQVELFLPDADPPSLLRGGDQVRFIAA